jgi:hypothetical protein
MLNFTLDTILLDNEGEIIDNYTAIRKMTDDEIVHRLIWIFLNFEKKYPPNIFEFLEKVNYVANARKINFQGKILGFINSKPSHSHSPTQPWPQPDISNICKGL